MGNEKNVQAQGMEDLWNVWYSELNNNNCGLTLKIDKIHESTKSKFQRIEVIENKLFGKMLVLYGSLMVCDNDNNAYNEMLSHVPLFVHPKPNRMLIIGGGDCGGLTEAIKHPDVKKIVMCEIDKKVVEISKKHFPYLTDGISDPRVEMVFEDGQKYIEKYNEKFDIITLDLSDPVGPAADLFQSPFHKKVYDALYDDGIMVAQSESPFFNKDAVKSMYHNLKLIFPIVKMYTCFMPIYPSAYWSFAFCSKKYDPVKDYRQEKFDRLNLKTRYYNDSTHRAAFALPEFVREIVGD